jgi:hypothetical protein
MTDRRKVNKRNFCKVLRRAFLKSEKKQDGESGNFESWGWLALA